MLLANFANRKSKIAKTINEMKKNQLLKLCFRWMPTSAMMLCTMTMLTAGPLLPKASAAIEQNAKPTQVTGMVTDGEKQPLIGVTITLVGTDVHALTDIDGMFHIDVPAGNKAVLEFNYIGFQKKQVNVNGAKLLNVVLDEETSEFEEVVVTGYSSQKKASIIGSIETIQPGELQFGTTRTLSNNLAGKLSGVIGIQRSGEPGYDDSNFWIRGISTFSGSNNPLILIDGVARDLNNVDVSEIESFSVLKDASASGALPCGALHQRTDKAAQVPRCTRLHDIAQRTGTTGWNGPAFYPVAD